MITDNIHVVTCLRDRWCFERQMQLLNILGYSGEYRVYCNETGQHRSKWLRFFDHALNRLTEPQRWQLRVTSVASIPGLIYRPLNSTNMFGSGYWRQQLVKLWDTSVYGDALSIDSKTWPLKPQAWQGTTGVDIDVSVRVADTPFAATEKICKHLWGTSLEHLGANLPPQYLTQDTVNQMIDHNWDRFLKTLQEFDWQESTLSEYWMYHTFQRTVLGYTQYPQRTQPRQLCFPQWNGKPKKLKKELEYNWHYWFTVKWHDQEIRYQVNPTQVFDTVKEYASRKAPLLKP